MKIQIIGALLITISSLTYCQENSEIDIITTVLKQYFDFPLSDTVYKRNGEIKKIRIIPPPSIVLLNETIPFKGRESVSEYWAYTVVADSIPYSALSINDSMRLEIDSILGFNGSITYITKEKKDQIFEKGGWDSYHEVFGYQPFVRFSRPIIDHLHGLATIYMTAGQDYLAGIGILYFLYKEDSTWRIEKSIMLWIS